MDSTRQFFSQLRKLAVTLETETAKLQEAFDRRKNEDDRDSSENSARAMRRYHKLNCDIENLKGEIRDQLAQERKRDNKVSNFVEACDILEKRCAQDIQTVRAHWEKYGYQAPSDTHKPAKCEAGEDGEEANPAEESQEKDGKNHSSTPPKASFTDVMRTPKLSDFGLSEMQVKRALAGMQSCAEVPPMPEMSFPLPSLDTLLLPMTPKCALRLDDIELQTPQMHNFGISEHTMSLFGKKADKPQRPQQNEPEQKATSVMECLPVHTKVKKLEPSEPPTICTPGLKIRKQDSGDPESPCRSEILPSTPELPAFQTPYMTRLVSTKKSARHPETVNMQRDHDSHTFDQPTPHDGATGSKHAWDCDFPHTSFMGMEEQEFPEMPNLESVWGRSLINQNPKVLKMTEHENGVKDPTIYSLDLDGPTQEFSLGTPRIRTNYQESNTPEMPELSSVTRDICQLVSQAQIKKTNIATVEPHIRPEKRKHSARTTAMTLPEVSEREFQSLPGYLRQMTLSNLNQAIHNINQFTREHQGEVREHQIEELKRIIRVGAKAPIYILCLTELKRLNREGEDNTAVFKLVTRS